MIFTGDELLRGDIVNTNQAYLGERLLDLGIFATHAVSSPTTWTPSSRPSARRSPAARRCWCSRAGWAPPRTISPARRRPRPSVVALEHHEDLLEQIRERFAARGFEMGESNRKQAQLPAGRRRIPISGTAPGFILEHVGTLVVALPGVPWELKEMWEGTVEPRLAARTGSGAGHAVRRITRVRHRRIHGRREAGGPALARAPTSRSALGRSSKNSPSSCGARPHRRAAQRLDEIQARVCAALGDRVFGVDGPGLAGDHRRTAAARAGPHGRGGRVVHRGPGRQALHRRPRQQRLLPRRRHRLQRRRQDEGAGRSGGVAGDSTGP